MDIIRGQKKEKNQLCGNYCSQNDQFNKFYFIVKLILIATFLFPEISEAYLDPGTGSFVFQMLIAAALGGLYAIKTFWGNIKAFFKKDNNK